MTADRLAAPGADERLERSPSRSRKQIALRLDPAVHDAVAKWAADELRSVNAQIEILIRRALKEAGRMPSQAGQIKRPGRPPKSA